MPNQCVSTSDKRSICASTTTHIKCAIELLDAAAAFSRQIELGIGLSSIFMTHWLLIELMNRVEPNEDGACIGQIQNSYMKVFVNRIILFDFFFRIVYFLSV